MTYEPGDLVYPADLPRRVLCRVLEVEVFAAGSGISQLLRLEPLEGQRWHPGTSLVRRGEAAPPLAKGDRWRARRPPPPPGPPTPAPRTPPPAHTPPRW